MAKNSHSWTGPTSWAHKGHVDKSGPDKNLSAHGRPETPAPTSMSHFKAVPFSGEGHPGLGNASTKMGAPHPMSSDRSEKMSGMSKPATIKKSMPDVPDSPKKWSRKGYNLMEGAHGSLAEADKFNAKEKAR